MTSVAPRSRLRSSRRRPLGRRARLGLAVASVALVATACGGGPGTQEEFNDILTRSGTISAAEADCISTAVFDEYGADEDALGKLSAAPDIEFLSGEEGIDGFGEFFDGTVAGCLEVGPSN